MPNPKGNPQNFEPIRSTRDKPLTEKMNIRMTKEMKEAVQQQDDPPEFCREAIQEKLDRNKGKSNP
ncbi:hypothetical protein H6G93_24580 [Nostoc sp. FACHB-973]|uniref:Uncharacterized protein n=1 Tax=Desmonostoc muscorum LEGE 12446 TaxID=1828758 RepID=A0A8J7D5K9_DESMC|nr:hypothetical protein [Desmonostoc muscorum]MBD2518096.1 hypothetical protein [Nostoc sp. FACHB-973]MBX9257720.1 hypothetical protein [Desmonostoc muscorum CCALA 125]MCF2147939.1 hypothetical protein [Desmonostoc muscorum LEGE 12446]